MFHRPYLSLDLLWYYAPVYINVNTTGYYNIASYSSSSLDMCGYIYNNSFNALVPSQNILLWNDDDAGDNQFLLSLFIDTAAKYILVVTTYYSNRTGTFSILTSQAGSINFIRMPQQ